MFEPWHLEDVFDKLVDSLRVAVFDSLFKAFAAEVRDSAIAYCLEVVMKKVLMGSSQHALMDNVPRTNSSFSVALLIGLFCDLLQVG